MINDTTAIAKLVLDAIQGKIERLKAAAEGPQRQGRILWFAKAELAANPHTGNVTDALSAPALPAGPPPVVWNGEGEEAIVIHRGAAIDIELARAVGHRETILSRYPTLA